MKTKTKSLKLGLIRDQNLGLKNSELIFYTALIGHK